MEFLLLWLDELDDAVAILRSLWPRLLGLLVATTLLFATGFAVLKAPAVALASIATVLSVALLERVRRRRSEGALPLDR